MRASRFAPAISHVSTAVGVLCFWPIAFQSIIAHELQSVQSVHVCIIHPPHGALAVSSGINSTPLSTLQKATGCASHTHCWPRFFLVIYNLCTARSLHCVSNALLVEMGGVNDAISIGTRAAAVLPVLFIAEKESSS
eukprot:IDg13984t1